MRAMPTAIPEVIVFEPRVFGDDRGFFFESFRQDIFDEAVGRPVQFVQDNHSKSSRGVLRGLHRQRPPHEQGKLVRVIQGEVFDVVVDLREGSVTYGKWVAEILSAHNKKQLWIPPGFAHGFLTLSDSAEFLYKTTDYYAPEFEQAIRWNDPTLAIDWPLKEPLLSGKDQVAPFL